MGSSHKTNVKLPTMEKIESLQKDREKLEFTCINEKVREEKSLTMEMNKSRDLGPQL